LYVTWCDSRVILC